MRPLSRDKAPSLIVLVLLTFSFITLAVIFPVHAAAPTPIIANDAICAWSSGLTYTCTLTIAAVGDAITVIGGVGGTVVSTNPVISSVSSTKAGNPSLLNKNFALIQAETFKCVGATGFCGGTAGQDKTGVESLWTAIANTTGSATITITVSASANIVSEAQAYDIEFSNNTPSAFIGNACNAVKNTDCGNPIAGGLTSGASDVILVGAGTYGNSVVSASGGCTFIGNGATAFGGSFFTGAATCGVNFTGNSGANSGYGVVTIIWSAAVTTKTTVINTSCLGSCSSGNNGTSIYLPPPTSTFFNLHFYASQNLATAAQIDNVTLKVANVHISTSSGTLYVLVYTATGIPTGGNPYSLVTQIAVSISNGSSNFFIHSNPQTNLAQNQYYAVGIMSATTKSNSAAVGGSGVSVYETSQSGIVEYKFSVGSAVPPNSFFSSTIQTPRDYIRINSTFTVATVTSTSTLTQSGLVTSTSTITTTSTNIINQLNMSAAGFWFIPLLFLLAPMALLIVVKRVADGR